MVPEYANKKLSLSEISLLENISTLICFLKYDYALVKNLQFPASYINISTW